MQTIETNDKTDTCVIARDNDVLKGRLNTAVARKVFSRCLRSGLMERTAQGLRFNGTQTQLAYLCGVVYCADRWEHDCTRAKCYVRCGRFPETGLNKLFGTTNLGKLRHQIYYYQDNYDMVSAVISDLIAE